MKSILDSTRLEALQSTLLLDSPHEAAFDRLTKMAAAILRTPMAIVSLVDDRRQFFKSAVGLPDTLTETPLSHSFCQARRRDT